MKVRDISVREFYEMDAALYYQIVNARDAWEQGIKDEQDAQRKADAQKQASA